MYEGNINAGFEGYRRKNELQLGWISNERTTRWDIKVVHSNKRREERRVTAYQIVRQVRKEHHNVTSCLPERHVSLRDRKSGLASRRNSHALLHRRPFMFLDQFR